MLDHLKSLLVACVLCVFSIATAEAGFRPVPIGPESNLFVWTDTCNVYVLRDGDAALLIDLGDGSVLDHLGEIGVRQVEWVLFTHHHREQCQGVAKLAAWKPQIAAPEVERALFEEPTRFRKAKPTLGDAYTVHGASYVRPSAGADPAESHVQGFGRIHLAGPGVPVPRHARATAPAGCPTC